MPTITLRPKTWEEVAVELGKEIERLQEENRKLMQELMKWMVEGGYAMTEEEIRRDLL